MRSTGLLVMKYERSFPRKIRVDVVVLNGGLRFIYDFRKLFSSYQYYHKCGFKQSTANLWKDEKLPCHSYQGRFNHYLVKINIPLLMSRVQMKKVFGHATFIGGRYKLSDYGHIINTKMR